MTSAGRRAFSLIELIAVIAIIALLATVFLAVGPAVLGKSEVSRTENILKLADMAIREWQNSGKDEITWGTETDVDEILSSYGREIVFDIQWEGSGGILTPSDQMTILITRMMRNDACKEILTQINADFLTNIYDSGDPTVVTGYELLDAWGNPIFMIHPGRKARPNDFAADSGLTIQNGGINDDGTIYVNEDYCTADGAFEQRYGICKNRQVLLVSAGPDGFFGDPLSGDELERERAQDNVFSYEPIEPFDPGVPMP